MGDWQLLGEYATRNSDEAFRTLVDRYAAMVYHTALRQLGNPHQAEEVTQAVFIALAQKAGKISRETILCGWLFRAARFAVLNLKRDEACRRRHEKEAATMELTNPSNDTDLTWEQISPLLDDALEKLSKADREIVMTRYFGNMSHKEVALTLGVTEDTAKKRLSRAVEKLRSIFAKRGVVVPSVALIAALAAHGAQAMPMGLASSVTAAALAKGSAASATTLASAKGILRLMVWAKAKIAILVGTGLLIAGGTAMVVTNAVNPSSENLINKLEQQTAKTIAWDRHLVLPADLDVKNPKLEQALDEISVKACAYWTVDYAVYGSDESLRRLLDALHDGAELQSAGWTNLSGRELHPAVSLKMNDPHGRSRGGMMMMRREKSPDTVPMAVVLNAEATAEMGRKFAESQSQGEMEGPPPGDGVFDAIRKAMANGLAEGVLAPERLLAGTELLPRQNTPLPMPATAEAAASLAKAAHAHWTTIYTLRVSPYAGAGIKLEHAGATNKLFSTNLDLPPGAMMANAQSNRFNLTPEDRAAHDKAVQAYKQQH